jgi:hypothetical protein
MPSIEENTIMKKTLLILGMISLILAACGGGDATPIISAEDVEQTALADARTMVANTQAAIPTNTQVPEDTPVPPSPIPTETSIALATVPQPTVALSTPTTFASQPTPTSAAGTGGCYPMQEWEVESAKINVYNQTKGIVTISVNVTLASGECGSFSLRYEKANSMIVPVGCAWVWAWVDGKEDFTHSTSFCMDTPRSYNVTVTNDGIKVK